MKKINGIGVSNRIRKKSEKNIVRGWRALLLAMALLCVPLPRETAAITLGKGERVSVALVTPVRNNTELRVWGSKYYPGDVLSEKMSNYLMRRLRETPRVHVGSVTGQNPDYWAMEAYSRNDLIISVNLEQFEYTKRDTVGSREHCALTLHIYVYDSSKRLIYDTVVRERDDRYYALYNDLMERDPVYWENFEKSLCWPALRHAMDEALDDVFASYNGYRVVGRIVARAERVDGSLSVPAKKMDKIYHIDLGREDSVRVGDILAVTRASSVRTVAPETPEMHFPQIVGRVRVIFVKGRDAVAEVVKESGDAPIQLGDALSMPLYGVRGSKSDF
ncbi:MAG: hypothetical protein LBS53_15615 [Synergistaceae bacterium]|jgi:hypothetical protein|nr:hypothetical protein [Synergistaceae bacterium]